MSESADQTHGSWGVRCMGLTCHSHKISSHPPPCFTKLNGTLIWDPAAPGGSNFARRATVVMQLATCAERPLLLETFTESTSPLGATLTRMTSLPACVGSVSRPFW